MSSFFEAKEVPFDHTAPHTVVVMGPPRSGTSMVSGILRLLGIYMGNCNTANNEDPRFNKKRGTESIRALIAQNNATYPVWGGKNPPPISITTRCRTWCELPSSSGSTAISLALPRASSSIRAMAIWPKWLGRTPCITRRFPSFLTVPPRPVFTSITTGFCWTPWRWPVTCQNACWINRWPRTCTTVSSAIVRRENTSRSRIFSDFGGLDP